jgi:Repeat of unknown function (DUF5648)
MNTGKSILYCAMLALLAAVLVFIPKTASGQQNAEQQPHMQAALQQLKQAQAELQRAEHDKGGHRVKAIQIIEQAESEVQAGIDYDNQHDTENRGTGVNQSASAEQKVPLFRLVLNNDHFYTTSTAERDQAARDGYKDEGIAGYVASSQIPGTVPLYRLINNNGSQVQRLYTASATERDSAISQSHYKLEGIAAYVLTSPEAGAVPLERLQQQGTGAYFYTISRPEADAAIAQGRYKNEGTCCYIWQH